MSPQINLEKMENCSTEGNGARSGGDFTHENSYYQKCLSSPGLGMWGLLGGTLGYHADIVVWVTSRHKISSGPRKLEFGEFLLSNFLNHGISHINIFKNPNFILSQKGGRSCVLMFAISSLLSFSWSFRTSLNFHAENPIFALFFPLPLTISHHYSPITKLFVQIWPVPI